MRAPGFHPVPSLVRRSDFRNPALSALISGAIILGLLNLSYVSGPDATANQAAASPTSPTRDLVSVGSTPVAVITKQVKVSPEIDNAGQKVTAPPHPGKGE
jgi:hypothetical protein